MSILGFTGTRNGMTAPQRESFRTLLADIRPLEFHHGDCVGADAEAHDIVREVLPDCWIVVHAPTDETHRAFKDGDEERIPKSHFARNREIVMCSDRVVGVSMTPMRTERGGTWYTLDYAVKTLGVATVIWPDGSMRAISNARPA